MVVIAFSRVFSYFFAGGQNGGVGGVGVAPCLEIEIRALPNGSIFNLYSSKKRNSPYLPTKKNLKKLKSKKTGEKHWFHFKTTTIRKLMSIIQTILSSFYSLPFPCNPPLLLPKLLFSSIFGLGRGGGEDGSDVRRALCSDGMKMVFFFFLIFFFFIILTFFLSFFFLFFFFSKRLVVLFKNIPHLCMMFVQTLFLQI